MNDSALETNRDISRILRCCWTNTNGLLVQMMSTVNYILIIYSPTCTDVLAVGFDGAMDRLMMKGMVAKRNKDQRELPRLEIYG
jgi:hypothetical protein